MLGLVLLEEKWAKVWVQRSTLSSVRRRLQSFASHGSERTVAQVTHGDSTSPRVGFGVVAEMCRSPVRRKPKVSRARGQRLDSVTTLTFSLCSMAGQGSPAGVGLRLSTLS